MFERDSWCDTNMLCSFKEFNKVVMCIYRYLLQKSYDKINHKKKKKLPQ